MSQLVTQLLGFSDLLLEVIETRPPNLNYGLELLRLIATQFYQPVVVHDSTLGAYRIPWTILAT